jgi:hypothetical protein
MLILGILYVHLNHPHHLCSQNQDKGCRYYHARDRVHCYTDNKRLRNNFICTAVTAVIVVLRYKKKTEAGSLPSLREEDEEE